MKKVAQFKTPNRPAPADLDIWVMAGSKDAAPELAGAIEADASASQVETRPAAVARILPPASGAGEKLARLTIDLPRGLHARFKSACALNNTRMLDEVRGFIEVWTQKNS
jgi:hypothetical protein